MHEMTGWRPRASGQIRALSMIWHLLKFLPLPLLIFVKRHSSPTIRLWLRQFLGADYTSIPDGIHQISDGRRFHIGPDDAYWTIHMGLSHEPEETSIVRELVRPGDTVVDVGANFGWYTTLLGQAVTPSGRVFSFEPVPSTYARLLEHVAINHLGPQITAVCAAAGEASGTATVYLFDSLSHVCASLSRMNFEKYQTVEASVIRVDEYLASQNVTSVDFLKCDAEGSELAALKGCGGLLYAHDAPILLVELNEETTRAFGYERRDIWEYLSSAGYDHFFEIISSHRLRRIFNLDALSQQNLICAKAVKIKQRLTGCEIAMQG